MKIPFTLTKEKVTKRMVKYSVSEDFADRGVIATVYIDQGRFDDDEDVFPESIEVVISY